jgi:hypothetical protein
MKAALYDFDTQPEAYRLAERNYKIAEIADDLETMVNCLAVAKENNLSFLIDDLRPEILYLQDAIRRH